MRVCERGRTVARTERIHRRSATGPGPAEPRGGRDPRRQRRLDELKLHAVEADEKSIRVDSFAEVPEGIDAVAHRVVHGGPRFRDPVVIDDEVRDQISELVTLAPLHNAPALEAIESRSRRFRMYRTLRSSTRRFIARSRPKLPSTQYRRSWREQWGIRRYGFQGLSVEWCAQRVPELLGYPVDRLVVCHLGGGSSVTAVLAGRSVDTTMGFTPLEGVPMTTRSGSIDPGALLYVLREGHHDVDSLDHALNFDSGVKGLAGERRRDDRRRAPRGPGDADAAPSSRGHAASPRSRRGGHGCVGRRARCPCVHGGIGEGSALVRERLSARLGFLGVDLDTRRTRSQPDCDVARTGRPSAFWSSRA